MSAAEQLRRRVVVLEEDELEALIKRAVRLALDMERGPRAVDEWLDSAQASELLGINARTLTKHAADGTIPASRIGKLWRFRRGDLERYLRGG